MNESDNRFASSEFKQVEGRGKMTPREFIFRYLYVLPWIAVSAFIFLTMAYLKVRYTTTIFEVRSSLLIKSDQDNGMAGKDQKFQELFMAGDNVNLSNEMEILRSRPVLSRVAKDLQLQMLCYGKGKVRSSLIYPDRPFRIEFLKRADSSLDFSSKIVVLNQSQFLLNEEKTPRKFDDTIVANGNSFSIKSEPGLNLLPMAHQEFVVLWLSMSSAVEGLIGSLRVGQLNEQSTILSLSFDSESKALGTDVLNSLMAVYDTLIVEDKNRMSTNTLRFINDRLYELNDTLKGVQGVLRNFMVENQAFDIDGQSRAYMDKVSESDKARIAQEVQLNILNWLLDYVGDKKNVYEMVPTNLGIEEPALAQLIIEYNRLQLERFNNLRTTSESNQLIQSMNNSLDKLRREMYQALLNVRQGYTISLSHLDKANQDLQAHITSLPGKSMQLLNIERQQKILEDLYSLLLQKKVETSISSASAISNSRVIEPALAGSSPVSPDKKKMYTFFLFIGALIPVAITALSQILRDKVMSRADIEKNTNTPILGDVGHSVGQESLVVTSTSRKLISEQFRIIRSNLQYFTKGVTNPTIMVTSSFSGEGKSFISTNIGAVMALTGKKTVIMEFDIRKPKIVSGLDLKRKSGISNYIIGKARFEDLVVKVEGVDGLYVIPCGPIPPNPSELLLDPKLDELMKEVKKNFEVVIMDTAPVGLVSDAISLGRYADCSLYIVRQGHTFKRQIGLIEDLYVSKKLPGLCIILNDFKGEGGYYGGYYGGGYGYYGGYGYSAKSGYFEGEQKKRSKSALSLFSKWLKK